MKREGSRALDDVSGRCFVVGSELCLPHDDKKSLYFAAMEAALKAQTEWNRAVRRPPSPDPSAYTLHRRRRQGKVECRRGSIEMEKGLADPALPDLG
jgi:hypothetical protein